MDLFAHPGWRQASPDPADPVFRRPLGLLELGFYWDAVYNGVAVTVNCFEVEVTAGLQGALFARANVEHAWLRLKQRYPLLGASVEERPSGQVEFVLHERALSQLRPGEVNFLEHLHTAVDVARFREELHNGPTVLDNVLLARLWVGRQQNAPRRWHIFIPVVHYITDGMANATIVREMCQELALLSSEAKIQTTPLAARLQGVLPTETLTPSSKASMPRKRWRFAIAKVIQGLRASKATGGHTLPTLPKPSSTPLSRTIRIYFTAAESRQIMAACRLLGITLGNALPVLSQLAFARVLYRLRHAGQITDAEWDRRLRQPMHYTGPMNHRPYLEREWYTGGGAAEVCIAISFYTLVLPALPRPNSPALDTTGAPPLAALLTPARFRARAQMARAQTKALLAHPLLHELHALRLPIRNARTYAAALAWRAGHKQAAPAPNPTPAADSQQAGRFADLAPCVFSNGGASLGDRDALMPECYPLAPPGGAPQWPVRLRLLSAAHDLRCRSGELYLGALTWRGRLQFFTAFDAHTYDAELVRAWTEEAKAAALAFLGGGLGGGVHARL